MSRDTLWFYAVGQQKFGPVSEETIYESVNDGTLNETTLVWRKGLDEWETIGNHFQLEAQNLPPPLPNQNSKDNNKRGESTSHLLSSGLSIYNTPKRTFSEAVLVCLKKFFVFSGRASRSEFWYFFVFIVLIGIVASIVDWQILGYDLSTGLGPIQFITRILDIPFLAVAWRRFHDVGRSGWWIVAGISLVAVTSLTEAVVGTIAYRASLLSELPSEPIISYFIIAALLVFFYIMASLPGQNKKNNFG